MPSSCLWLLNIICVSPLLSLKAVVFLVVCLPGVIQMESRALSMLGELLPQWDERKLIHLLCNPGWPWILLLICVCVFICIHTCQSLSVDSGQLGQHGRAGSLVPSRVFWRSESHQQPWQQVPLPTGPSHWPLNLIWSPGWPEPLIFLFLPPTPGIIVMCQCAW